MLIVIYKRPDQGAFFIYYMSFKHDSWPNLYIHVDVCNFFQSTVWRGEDSYVRKTIKLEIIPADSFSNGNPFK